VTITNAGALSSADWFKSSYSNDQGGDCVEGARLANGAMMAVRDSKVPDGPAFAVQAEAWTSFVAGLICGEAL
jgi:hypothetical protein